MCSQVMFGMLDCMDILGYDNPWLVNDLRMQCFDWKMCSLTVECVLLR